MGFRITPLIETEFIPTESGNKDPGETSKSSRIISVRFARLERVLTSPQCGHFIACVLTYSKQASRPVAIK